MTFHVKSISVFIGLAFTLVLAYSANNHSFLENMIQTRLDKEEEYLVPKVVTKKPVFLDHVKKDTDFTFFETLLDPKLQKHVGLKGDVEKFSLHSTEKRVWSKKLSESSIVGSFSRVTKGSTPPEKASIKFKKDSRDFGKDLLEDSFLVQAASFKNQKHAQKLVNEMKKKGYKAFLRRTKNKVNEPWYRVYLGRFKNKDKAMKTIYQAKLDEKLNPIVVLQKIKGD